MTFTGPSSITDSLFGQVHTAAATTTTTDPRQAYINYLEAGRQTNLASTDPATVARQKTLDNTFGAGTGDPSSQSAVAILTDALSQAGLGSLAAQVWDWWKQGRSLDQINLDVKGTPEYKSRFAGMAPLIAKGRAINEAQYIANERTYAEAMRAAGLPSNFYDQPSDFATLIGNEVSPAEFNSRLQAYTTLTYQMPKEVMDAFAQQAGFSNWSQTGWSNGDLAAFFMDPDKALPAIQGKLQRAEIQGAAGVTGYGSLDQGELDRLASLGVDFTKGAQGFEQLQQLSPLFNPLPGEAGPGIDQQTQLAAEFGSSAAAQTQIDRMRQQRISPFQSGGTLAGANRGATSGAGEAV